LAFTRDGLEAVLNSARANYLLGEIYSACGLKEEAVTKLGEAAGASGVSDLVWAHAAAKNLSGYDAADWMKRLKRGISQADGNSGSWWKYTAGILRTAAGEKDQGQADLQEALLLPEVRMSWHLSAVALEGGKW
jgi:hypothetical protein